MPSILRELLALRSSSTLVTSGKHVLSAALSARKRGKVLSLAASVKVALSEWEMQQLPKTQVSGAVSVSNRIFDSWSNKMRISHEMVSARYSAKTSVKYGLSGLSIWKQQPSRSLSTCLPSPPSGIVNRPNDQLRGKWTNSRNLSWPSLSMMPGASLLVTPLTYCLVFWSQAKRAKNPSWGNCSMVPSATDQVQHLRELVVVGEDYLWGKQGAKRKRYHDGTPHPKDREGSPLVWTAWFHLLCAVSGKLGLNSGRAVVWEVLAIRWSL